MSEQVKHTPGPWKCARESDGEWMIVTDAAGNIVANVNAETGPSAASAPAMHVMPQDANARLITAAPDLLKACELAVYNEEKADGLRGTGLVDDVDIKALRAIARAARAAIAKAKGK